MIQRTALYVLLLLLLLLGLRTGFWTAVRNPVRIPVQSGSDWTELVSERTVWTGLSRSPGVHGLD